MEKQLFIYSVFVILTLNMSYSNSLCHVWGDSFGTPCVPKCWKWRIRDETVGLAGLSKWTLDTKQIFCWLLECIEKPACPLKTLPESVIRSVFSQILELLTLDSCTPVQGGGGLDHPKYLRISERDQNAPGNIVDAIFCGEGRRWGGGT